MSRPDITRFVIRGNGDSSYDIAVSGPLDTGASSSLRCLLADLERHRVTIDLTECSSITDHALNSLTTASRIAQAHGGTLLVQPVGRSSESGDCAVA